MTLSPRSNCKLTSAYQMAYQMAPISCCVLLTGGYLPHGTPEKGPGAWGRACPKHYGLGIEGLPAPLGPKGSETARGAKGAWDGG